MSGYILVVYFNKSEKKEDFTCLLFVFFTYICDSLGDFI